MLRNQRSPKKSKKDYHPQHFVYADFECSTDGTHKAYNICYESNDGKFKGSIWGVNCAIEFLERLEDLTQVYFHDLSYDINFIINYLDSVKGTPIIKGSQTMSIQGEYKRKTLFFRDSYAIISKALKEFSTIFHLQTGPKRDYSHTHTTIQILFKEELESSVMLSNMSVILKHSSTTSTLFQSVS